jgi:hypothetical protein
MSCKLFDHGADAVSTTPAEKLSPERRIFRRVPMSAEIILTAEYGVFTGMMVNLSMGGLFVVISRRMKAAVGDPLRISIPLTGEFLNDSIHVAGTVVRVERKGLAVRFQEMDRITFHTLLSMINRPAR